jgi:hypothetical protein
MRRPLVMLLSLGLLSAAAGCRNCELVEAELRTREIDLREVRAELARVEAHNEALVRELGALRHSAPAKMSPEQASQTYTLQQITLGRQTGGYDDDTCPGDEALQVVLEPRDPDGHTIKAPGALHVEALEVSPQGLKTALSGWDVSPDHLRRTWRSGLLGAGYYVILPWKAWPSTDKLRVVARFTLADGRLFEADKDVTLRLSTAAPRRAVPAIPLPEPLPLAPPLERTLPMPRKLPGGPAPANEPVEPAGLWRPPRTGSLADAVELLPPAPLPPRP